MMFVLTLTLVVGLGAIQARAQDNASDADTAAPTDPPASSPGEIPPPAELPAGTPEVPPELGLPAGGPGELPAPVPDPKPAEEPVQPEPPAATPQPQSPADPVESPGGMPAPPEELFSPTNPSATKESVEGPSPSNADPSPRDEQVDQTQAKPLGASQAPKGMRKGENPLPPAQAGPDAASAGSAPNGADEFVLAPSRLRSGLQSVGLTIEVKGPPALNMNTPATYRIIVSNPNAADAEGVTVRDVLPPELEFISSQPVELKAPGGLLVWHLGNVPAGTQREITLKVKPIKVGTYEHGATVSMRAGSKVSTHVFQPQLRVEIVSTSSTVLKGKTAECRVVVHNPGDGIARSVRVRAKLSKGLQLYAQDTRGVNTYELDVFDLPAGQRISLSPLVVDTVEGGEQSFQIEAVSPDVAEGGQDSTATQVVNVIEPKIDLRLTGPRARYSDTIATYYLEVVNNGTAPANNVRVQATVPIQARLMRLPDGATFDARTRRLTWPGFQLDPGEKDQVKFQFDVKLGSPGSCEISAHAVAEQCRQVDQMIHTQVDPMADLSMEIVEERRVIDVGEKTIFVVKIQNHGSKEATKIIVKGAHSPNFKALRTSGTEEEARYLFEVDAAGKAKKDGELLFPTIDRLDPGKEIELAIEVEGLSSGLGYFRLYASFDEIDQPVEAKEVLRVTKVNGK